MNSFLKIDELTESIHTYIDIEEDDCYYLANYTSQKGYSYSEANSIISNLKKKPSTSGNPGYKYKKEAIIKVAEALRKLFEQEFIDSVTFVPIPPSKNKAHEDYDDRMLRIITIATRNRNADIRELVECINSKEASHESAIRPSIPELKRNLQIIDEHCDDLRGTVVLIDDVLTTGAHFIAVKEVLKSRFPELHVIGIFICRRDFADDENF